MRVSPLSGVSQSEVGPLSEVRERSVLCPGSEGGQSWSSVRGQSEGSPLSGVSGDKATDRSAAGGRGLPAVRLLSRVVNPRLSRCESSGPVLAALSYHCRVNCALRPPALMEEKTELRLQAAAP